MYKIYVLESEKDGNWYIGCTSDLSRRVKMHQLGHVKSTKSRLPMKLIYSEENADKYEAFRIEKFYKTAVGKRALRKKM